VNFSGQYTYTADANGYTAWEGLDWLPNNQNNVSFLPAQGWTYFAGQQEGIYGGTNAICTVVNGLATDFVYQLLGNPGPGNIDNVGEYSHTQGGGSNFVQAMF